MQIDDAISKILRSQMCKKMIQQKLIQHKQRLICQPYLKCSLIPLQSMIFQVVTQSSISDNTYNYQCLYQLKNQLKVPLSQRYQSQIPKIGSFIRTTKMDFNLNTFQIIIYDYQYLGGEKSIVNNAQKIVWNQHDIMHIVNKNITKKNGNLLMNSFANIKKSNQQFQIPKIQSLSVKFMQNYFIQSQKQKIQQLIPKKILNSQGVFQNKKQPIKQNKQMIEQNKQMVEQNKQIIQSNKQIIQSNKQITSNQQIIQSNQQFLIINKQIIENSIQVQKCRYIIQQEQSLMLGQHQSSQQNVQQYIQEDLIVQNLIKEQFIVHIKEQFIVHIKQQVQDPIKTSHNEQTAFKQFKQIAVQIQQKQQQRQIEQ